MQYTEIAVYTTSEASEVVAYFLQEVCMDGISIYDKKDLYDNASWDYKDDSADMQYCDEVVVKGYCNLEDAERVLDFLRERLSSLCNAGSLEIKTGIVDGDLWVSKFKETFKPIETEKLVICPEWQTCDTDKKKLLLDTGVAFGTGQHETTAMCLQFAEESDLNGKRVLDVGCGSGILGLSALLLGAESAELVDIDGQATAICAHNAEINGLADKCAIKTGNLTEQTSGRFDVIFANLTADILELLHNGISEVVLQGSTVILSGILDVKLPYVIKLYSDRFTVLQSKSSGEWRALRLQAK
ncbi:MAG: 50S ribosomal protein L11 methyltransferase [Corallococcus sp.]|nr:50S ribosomal protein L11 methyltransferase [Corallococcus sp.]